MSRRGKTPLKTTLKHHPERIAHHSGDERDNLIFTFAQGRDGTTMNRELLEMRDLETGKLAGHANTQGHQHLRCPVCKHRYILSYQDFFAMCLVALITRRSYGWRCTACKWAPYVLKIVMRDGREAMIEIDIRR